MLVLSRQIGECVLIDDVVFTLVRIAGSYVEVSLSETTDEGFHVLTLLNQQPIELLDNVQVVFLGTNGLKARFGFDFPRGTQFIRKEFAPD